MATTDADIRSARLAALSTALITCLVGLAVALVWVGKKSWRRLLPAYWVLAELAVCLLGPAFGATGATVALIAAAVLAVAGGWPARSLIVRCYRLTVAGVLGGFATLTVAAGPDTLSAHPTLTIFGPSLAAGILGWPWWHHLRTRVEAEPAPEPMKVDESLTALWAARWKAEVVEQGVCPNTRLLDARTPRPGVTEATIRLAPGTKPKNIVTKGSEVEVALDLDEGAVGWRSTGKAAKLTIVIVEKSHIIDGVTWHGPTYAGGKCQLTTFTDGSPGLWTFSRPNFGVLCGLVVGSSGAGKSRALGVLIENLLHAQWMVIILDPQNGQSLPDWKDAVGEYHDAPDPVTLTLRRYHAEVMARSKMLAAAGVNVFDENDPRVKALNLKKMMAFLDECQLVLRPEAKKLIALVEDILALCRKTGCGLILATQIPQMKSLGGSIRIRDAAVAGNAFIMRLSNRGSGTTVLPDDFVGDPFALPAEIDGKITAGMGYLRTATQVGMLSRVPNQDEAAAAAACPRTPVEWQVDPIDPKAPIATAATTSAGGSDNGSAASRLRAAFGVKTRQAAVDDQPANTPEWVLTCLRRSPASAQALLDRPDCPVKQPQLYTVLGNLTKTGKIVAPARRGEPYTLA